MKKWIKELYKLDSRPPCAEAVEWAENYDTLQEAWDACPRGDWMVWLLDRILVDHKKIVQLSCMNARLSLPYITDPHVRYLIEVIEAWVEGKATAKDVTAAWAVTMTPAEAAWASRAEELSMLKACADNARKIFPAIQKALEQNNSELF
jgi:hypothetical protein